MNHYILDIKTPAQKQASALKPEYGLENHGLRNLRNVYWNLPAEALYEEAIFRSRRKDLLSGPADRRHRQAYRSRRERQVHRP